MNRSSFYLVLFLFFAVCLLQQSGIGPFACPSTANADESTDQDLSPPAGEQQLPLQMHSQMKDRPHLRVGVKEGDIIGSDNRALQAAVDYIAGLGGGTVEIGPGEYLMRDSLHLRSGVHVRGADAATVLRKAEGVVVPLMLDGDFGEQQITVNGDVRFDVGQGIAIWDDRAGGFHTTVARITGRSGNTYSIDKPLGADCMVSNHAKAGTLFPVISGYDVVDVQLHGLTIEGSKETNEHLNGCRGGGIFFYRAFGTVIENCVARNYDGDGISFQQSNDVSVLNCVVEGNTQLGLHPGSGSQRPTIRGCTARNNGTDGLYLCWRVRYGQFDDNLFENNGRFGISIGHKDTDNLFQKNTVRLNHSNGVFFRNESLGMAAHRNRLIGNTIENNGSKAGTAAIRVRGETRDLVFKDNVIRDTRSGDEKTQTVGLLLESQVGKVELKDNTVKAEQTIVDERQR